MRASLPTAMRGIEGEGRKGRRLEEAQVEAAEEEEARVGRSELGTPRMTVMSVEARDRRRAASGA